MRLPPLGESRVCDGSATDICVVNDAQLGPTVPGPSSLVAGYQPSVTWIIVFPDA